MRNYKKYLAAILAATMVVGSSVVVNAAQPGYVSSSDVTISDSNAAAGTIGGTGSLEGTTPDEVFTVVVPACMTGNDADFSGFKFVLDPQKLITETGGSRYTTGSNATATDIVRDKTLYFVNKTSGIIDDTSDMLKVTNKSSKAVQIDLDAEISGAANIPMSATDTFTDDTSTSMYMALKVGTEKTAIVKGTDNKNKAHVDGVIPGAPNAYETKVVNGSYEKVMKDNVDEASFGKFEFALTGASNSNPEADWAALPAGNAPAVVITWKIDWAPEPEAPSLPDASKTVNKPASGDLTINVNLGVGTAKANGITSVSFVNPTNNSVKNLSADNYSFANGKLTIKEAALATVTADREYTITFDDTAATKAKFTVKVTN